MEHNHVNNFALNFEDGKRAYQMMNVSIVLCSFVESYVFPFAIMKWMIAIAKYGGLLSLLNSYNYKEAVKETSKSQYKYSLQLVTTSPNSSEEKCEDSEDRVTHISVITVQDPHENRTHLSYCGQNDCVRIPTALAKMYGPRVHNLDLSYNSIETLKGLEQFGRLQELILDNNKLGDAVHFPYLPNLKTLTLNNNQIIDLEGLLDMIRERLPGLTYLSLLRNKACPNELSDNDKDESDYQRYRYFVIHKIPSLRFLDSRRVSPSERAEALKRGAYMRVRRPAEPLDAPGVMTVEGSGVRALPVDLAALGRHKGAYGKVHYKYTGKHSEGNRFIVNSDL